MINLHNIQLGIIYNGFRIDSLKIGKRTTYRIYRDNQYLQTCRSKKAAKAAIDFNVANGVWK